MIEYDFENFIDANLKNYSDIKSVLMIGNDDNFLKYLNKFFDNIKVVSSSKLYAQNNLNFDFTKNKMITRFDLVIVVNYLNDSNFINILNINCKTLIIFDHYSINNDFINKFYNIEDYNDFEGNKAFYCTKKINKNNFNNKSKTSYFNFYDDVKVSSHKIIDW